MTCFYCSALILQKEMKSISCVVTSYNPVSDLSLTRVLTLSYLNCVLLNCNHSLINTAGPYYVSLYMFPIQMWVKESCFLSYLWVWKHHPWRQLSTRSSQILSGHLQRTKILQFNIYTYLSYCFPTTYSDCNLLASTWRKDMKIISAFLDRFPVSLRQLLPHKVSSINTPECFKALHCYHLWQATSNCCVLSQSRMWKCWETHSNGVTQKQPDTHPCPCTNTFTRLKPNIFWVIFGVQELCLCASVKATSLRSIEQLLYAVLCLPFIT